MPEFLDDEMVASYGVEIRGIDRTKREMAALDREIKLLRGTKYNATSKGKAISVAETSFGTSRSSKLGKDDIFVAKIDLLEGRIQTVTQEALSSGMALGKRAQKATLEAAVTETGLQRPGRGPGRNKTGGLISRLATNVETQKSAKSTFMVGWHGWPKIGRERYDPFQELGTKGRKSGQQTGSVRRKVKARRKGAKGRGVPAANSLGAAIILVREHLKRELKGLKR